MNVIKIGLIREEKKPYDKRVALLPHQCQFIQKTFPNFRFFVQPSLHRIVTDQAYIEQNIEVMEDLSGCDILFGIKEVPPQFLIPNKTYFIFSHTIKKQAHNQALLRKVLDSNIKLVDYECLVDENGERLVAFGFYAGLVGAYNTFRVIGQREKSYSPKPAHLCKNFEEMKAELQKLKPERLKIIVTGAGRVGKGVLEVLRLLPIQHIEPENFEHYSGKENVFTILHSKHLYQHKSDIIGFNKSDFYKNPYDYISAFHKYYTSANILIAAAYWNPNAAPLFKSEEVSKQDFKIEIISDITCDVNGSIPTTLRASSITEPFYDVDKNSLEEKPAFSNRNHISVTAIDNLPCEIPYDASEAFGNQLIKHVFPFINEPNAVIQGATIAEKGKLLPKFEFLKDYAEAKAEKV